MEIATCTKADFDQILAQVTAFWGSERTLALHHPLFLYELGDTAYVIREGEQVVAYLFGVLSQTEPVGYVHLVGVREGHRRQGLAQRLYDHFAAHVRAHGCTELKAITTPGNRASLAFHASIGLLPAEGELVGGVQVVRDYAGPGQDRVVLRKRLA